MAIYTPYELEQKGVKLSALQSHLEWDGVIYTKGQTMPVGSQNLAEKMRQSYLADGYQCFIMLANQMLTIWYADPPATAEVEEVSNADSSEDNAPSKPKLLYRGVPVDTTLPDIAQGGEAKPIFYRGAPVVKSPEVPESEEQSPAKKRTYRGVEY